MGKARLILKIVSLGLTLASAIVTPIITKKENEKILADLVKQHFENQKGL